MLKSVQIREGHDNFFTPLRLIFATLVVIGHSFAVALRDANAEPQVFLHYNFSYIAVNLFFIASGFLVTKSMLYRGDVANYASARALRIYPALIVHVLFVMFVIGLLATKLPWSEFLTHPDFLKQPFLVLSFVETNMVMPGAFLDNGEQLGSAPLWTLRYEVLAYIGTALVFMLGLLKRKWMVLAQFIVPSILWLVTHQFGIFETLPGTFQNLLRFGIAYGLGATIYAYRERLNFNPLLIPVLFGLTALTASFHSVEIMLNLALGYFLMWAAFIKIPALNPLQKMGDLSYGVYIYHWCIFQVIFQYFPGLNSWTLLAITLPLTFLMAKLSWDFVEKPMLAKKKNLSGFFSRGRKKKAPYDPKSVLLD